MTAPLFRSYRGPLTPSQAVQGIRVAQANARRLLDDARALAGAKRFATALGVAVLAAEEAAKPWLLLWIAASPRGDLGAAWKNYRSHVPKALGVIMSAAMRQGAKCLAELMKYFEDDVLMRQPDAYKQLAFYSECVEGPTWAEPLQIVTSEVAASAIQCAADVVGLDDGFDEEAVATFVARVGPALATDDEAIVLEAYRRWALELVKRKSPETSIAQVLGWLKLTHSPPEAGEGASVEPTTSTSDKATQPPT